MALHARPTRRRFAGSVAAVLGTGLAGCTSHALDDAYAPPPEHTPISEECKRENQEVLDLKVLNYDSAPHVITVAVTGVRDDSDNERIFEETYELGPDQLAARAVAFNPDREDIERYDDFVATASTEDGQIDSNGVYTEVVRRPILTGVRVTVSSSEGLTVGGVVADPVEWETC